MSAAAQPRLASRRHWLKGLGALMGTGLLTAPATLLAAPVAPAAASALVGGDEYIGMVKMLATATLPQGWAHCDGRHLPTGQYPALFAMLGTLYGGDGENTFALPKLAGPDRLPDGRVFAIKIANAPATTGDGITLRLAHHRRPRTARAV
ncbi:phage tail protein [Hymenobacter daecheongensis]|uniref:phage tail protein n=1 Tax=Hymenobacter daecheongensis TaxID=496053 RepID=UPI0009354CF2|nr:phage tail protein [Hymenobacter daecheongensis]